MEKAPSTDLINSLAGKLVGEFQVEMNSFRVSLVANCDDAVLNAHPEDRDALYDYRLIERNPDGSWQPTISGIALVAMMISSNQISAFDGNEEACLSADRYLRTFVENHSDKHSS